MFEALALVIIGMAMGWAMPGYPEGRLLLGAELNRAHYSVGILPDGATVYGAYGQGQPASIAYAAPGSLDVQEDFWTGPVLESVSGFAWRGGGLDVFTEGKASIYRAQPGGGELQELCSFSQPDPYMYIFAGPSAQKAGVVTVSAGLDRDVGAKVGVPAAAGGYELAGPQARDEEGRPLLAWDAVKVGDEWAMGCAWSQMSRFKEPDAGRVVIGDQVTNYRGGGALQIARPSWDSQSLHVFTAWGEWWRGDLAGQSWELLWQGPRGHDLRMYEAGGEPLLVSSAGKIFKGRQPELVAELDDCGWLSLAAGDNYLAGTAKTGSTWRTVRFEYE